MKRLIFFIFWTIFLEWTSAQSCRPNNNIAGTTYENPNAINDDETGTIDTLTVADITSATVDDIYMDVEVSVEDGTVRVFVTENFQNYEANTQSGATVLWYYFNIQLTCGSISEVITFNQRIIDINNHEPEFRQSEYRYSLPMPFPAQIEITQFGPALTARDIDITNTDITFEVIDSDYFSFTTIGTVDSLLKEHQATMIALRPLEFSDTVTFTLRATDAGSPELSSTDILLHIEVDSENSVTSAPLFGEALYEYDYENFPVSSETAYKLSISDAESATFSFSQYGSNIGHTYKDGELLIWLTSELDADDIEREGYRPIVITASISDTKFARTVLILRLPESECEVCEICPEPEVCEICEICEICPEPEVCPECPEPEECEVCEICPEPEVCPECPEPEECEVCEICPDTEECPECPLECPDPEECPECPLECPDTEECPECPLECPDTEECPECPLECPDCPLECPDTEECPDPEECPECPLECPDTEECPDPEECPECPLECPDTEECPDPEECPECPLECPDTEECPDPEECPECPLECPDTEECPECPIECPDQEDCPIECPDTEECPECPLECPDTEDCPLECPDTEECPECPLECPDTEDCPLECPDTEECPECPLECPDTEECPECPLECPDTEDCPLECPDPEECTECPLECPDTEDCPDPEECPICPIECPDTEDCPDPEECQECPLECPDTEDCPLECPDTEECPDCPLECPDTDDCPECPLECPDTEECPEDPGCPECPSVEDPDCTVCPCDCDITDPTEADITFAGAPFKFTLTSSETLATVAIPLTAASTIDEEIRYTSTDYPSDLLYLDPVTAILRNKELLDGGVYEFSVLATGQTSQATATATVTIVVTALEICNNGPVMTYAHFLTYVDENMEAPILPLTTEDSEQNIEYDIADVTPSAGLGLFYIDEGTVYCRELDREADHFAEMEVAQYIITVKVTAVEENVYNEKYRNSIFNIDNKNTYATTREDTCQCATVGKIYTQTSQTQITVVVGDVNDNTPEFTSTSVVIGYPAKSLLSTVTPSYLIQVEATDADIGENAELAYYVSSSDVTIHPSTGVIYPTEGFPDNDFTFTVTARDQNGNGWESSNSLEVQVKILGQDHISVISVRNHFLEDADDKVSELNELGNINIRTLQASVLPSQTSTRQTRAGEDYYLIITVYAFDINNNLITSETLGNILESVDDLSINTLPDSNTDCEVCEDCDEDKDCEVCEDCEDNKDCEICEECDEDKDCDVCEDCDDDKDCDCDSNSTGLIAAVSVLSVLLLLVIVGFVVFYYFKLRKNKQYSEMEEEEATSSTQFAKNIAMGRSSSKLSHSGDKPERRPTGIVFAAPVGDTTDHASSSTSPPRERKSVAFNANVEQINIDTSHDNESSKL